MSRAVSSRWSPTTEQLMILEELYRSGIRTPSASQIKHITTHLSFYGRIEGKNVFYWFQNHKARDRLKLRRKINKQRQLQQQILQVHHCPPNEDISHYFVGSFDYPLGSSTQQLSFYNSAGLFFPGGAADTSGHAINCKWSVHNPQSLVEQTEMTFYNYEYDWTLVDVNQASSCCIRPLKTLDLFPVTATKLKDCNTWPKHLYHFMPNN